MKDDFKIVLEFHTGGPEPAHRFTTTLGVYKHWKYSHKYENVKGKSLVIAYTILVLLDWLEHEEKYKKIQEVNDKVEKLLS